MGNFDNGYIKLFRKILDWEWYPDINTRIVFIHCLLKANWKDKKWKGLEVKRGAFVSSLRHLSREIGISERCLRTALAHLEVTQEVTQSAYAKYSVFTVVHYDDYQATDTVTDTVPDDNLTHKPTHKTRADRQTTDTVPTTTEEYKENKIGKNKRKDERGRIVPINPPKKGWEWVDTMSPQSMLDHQEIDGWILENDEDGFLWAHRKGRK